MNGTRQGMYVAFVKNAMVQKAQGQLAPYEELVAQFQVGTLARPASTDGASSVTLLHSWIVALTHVAPLLDRSCATLVDAVIELPWLALPADAGDAWAHLVCAIVSARSEWVTRVVSLLFQNMGLQLGWYRTGDLAVLQERASQPTRRQLYARLHELLQMLLRLIPTLPGTLPPLLLQHFPHKQERTMSQVLYIQNLLRISEYCEALTEPIWSAIIDHALQVDVAIQVELDDLEDHGLEQAGPTNLDPVLDGDADTLSEPESPDLALSVHGTDDVLDSLEDLSDEEGYDASDALSPAAPTPAEPSWNEIAALAGKLDAIMKAIYQFLDGHVGGLAHHDVHARRYTLYQTLLGIFTRTVLTTFKSRHVQFILFWFASLDHEFADMFLGTLLSKSLYATPAAGVASESGDSSVVLRIAAASYVASYVARARYIDAPTTRMVVLNLCTYMDACLEAFASQGLSASPPGAREHAVFYAVAQAVFYIFCFRWRDLRDGAVSDAPHVPDEDGMPSLAATYPTAGSLELSPQLMPMLHASSLSSVSSTHSIQGERGWAPGLAVVQRAITSPLNPLRYCNANVVQQFAYVAQYTGFLYCYSVLEANSQRPSTDAPASPAATRRVQSTTRESTPTASTTVGRSKMPAAPAALPTPALDVFFPFDPYRLRDSAALVHRLYRDWSDVAPDGDGVDEEDDEEDEDDAPPSDSELHPMSPAQRAPMSARLRTSRTGHAPESIAQSLEAMSISPYTG
ncbi:DNA independent RNA polymerase I transcription factor [Malassezia caprae]|uniref:DNA independent RNA polymerase I transcription factor n=1 Tax=Malassezia caprae TaxID=1381934 RepID=A0AAF0E6B9_9BASI|nr:DNA independent RNA polymerase I transcription factor [Malassezia caprae]